MAVIISQEDRHVGSSISLIVGERFILIQPIELLVILKTILKVTNLPTKRLWKVVLRLGEAKIRLPMMGKGVD